MHVIARSPTERRGNLKYGLLRFTRNDTGSACDDVFMTDTVLCVDIGTTSLKAGLITADGEVVSFCSVPFEEPHDRFVACSWYDAFLRAAAELSHGRENITVTGISISGNGPTVVTDIGFTFRWNEDTSAVSELIPNCARTSLFIPKILSIKKQFPDVWKKTKKFFSGPEYLIFVLTGNAVTILPEERFEKAYWNDEMLEACGIRNNLLPSFVKTGESCGFLNQNISLVSNLRFVQDCPVIAGGPDFVAALIGTGTLVSGRLCDRCGSSEGLNFCTDKILKGEGLRILPSVIPGLWNASYLIPNSGELTEEQRLAEVERGINSLKKAAAEVGVRFPDEMAVTGGQTNDELLLREKSERLEMKILRPAVCDSGVDGKGSGSASSSSSGVHFVHSELIGDACAAYGGASGIYDSLQSAAEHIVKLESYTGA